MLLYVLGLVGLSLLRFASHDVVPWLGAVFIAACTYGRIGTSLCQVLSLRTRLQVVDEVLVEEIEDSKILKSQSDSALFSRR